MSVPPLCLAANICNNVVRDADTRKFHLLGVSNLFSFGEFPATTNLEVFLSFTEVNGTYNLQIRVVHVIEEEESIHQVSGTLVGNDPLAIFQFVLPLNRLQFPAPGEYRLQILVDGEIIAERKMAVPEKSGDANGE